MPAPHYRGPRRTDHCTRSRAAPTIPGTPNRTHGFAGERGVLRTAAAWLTPSFRPLAICAPASTDGSGGRLIASMVPLVGIGCGSTDAIGEGGVGGAACDDFSAAGAGTAPGNMFARRTAEGSIFSHWSSNSLALGSGQARR